MEFSFYPLNDCVYQSSGTYYAAIIAGRHVRPKLAIGSFDHVLVALHLMFAGAFHDRDNIRGQIV